ncbi:response regulator transcription factor [Streptomyces atriruber]|uniref:Response regulator transcription factor n=1 Tax=Streptomyces atriruber TaxID=545121 RepID=A0ABV3BYC0_9ACTN
MSTAERNGPGKLRLVLVDDEALMRSGLEMILDAAGDMMVVASCGGRDAFATVAAHRPDAVLLDIQMPDVDGLTVLRQLRTLDEPPAVVMLTAFGPDRYVHLALRDGAAGYLLKDTEPAHLADQVRALARGGRPLAPAVTAQVIDGYLAHRADHLDATRAVRALSPREREVLGLVGQGLTNQQIARRMCISPSTAKDHVSALLAKLGYANRVQAAVLAERARLLDPSPAPSHG